MAWVSAATGCHAWPSAECAVLKRSYRDERKPSLNERASRFTALGLGSRWRPSGLRDLFTDDFDVQRLEKLTVLGQVFHVPALEALSVASVQVPVRVQVTPTAGQAFSCSISILSPNIFRPKIFGPVR